MTNAEKFNAILSKNKNNFDVQKEFEKDPVSFLKAAEIPLVEEPPPEQLKAKISEELSVKLKWWGVNIVMNQKMTQNIIDGTIASGTLAGSITTALATAGLITGGAATVIGAALAGAFALKVAEIKVINDGKGVSWPITWLQWAAVLAAVPTGPAGVGAAIMLFIHPVRN